MLNISDLFSHLYYQGDYYRNPGASLESASDALISRPESSSVAPREGSFAIVASAVAQQECDSTDRLYSGTNSFAVIKGSGLFTHVSY